MDGINGWFGIRARADVTTDTEYVLTVTGVNTTSGNESKVSFGVIKVDALPPELPSTNITPQQGWFNSTLEINVSISDAVVGVDPSNVQFNLTDPTGVAIIHGFLRFVGNVTPNSTCIDGSGVTWGLELESGCNRTSRGELHSVCECYRSIRAYCAC